jgi:TetR/AcrR family transcriptional repressor of mexCD-oprJ operon
MAVNPPLRDHRREVAKRNLATILDAAERLLERGTPATVSAVAAEAGLSRVTVYAHFPTLDGVLEAVVERAVRTSATEMDAAGLDDGSAADALDRLVALAWRALDRHHAIARAAAEQLSSHTLRHLHGPAVSTVRRLVDRGREEGGFRTDLPAEWLVASSFALVHTAADEVRAGRLQPAAAAGVLRTTLRDLFLARSPERETKQQ